MVAIVPAPANASAIAVGLSNATNFLKVPAPEPLINLVDDKIGIFSHSLSGDTVFYEFIYDWYKLFHYFLKYI
ncbi:hypothetical protein ACQKNS_02170 [Peribacillus sp. NPDC094092]|uniref:hypothetical protein n=1 Tax=Peribacillus sp. NPDC094092 TaxID=3390611 RepID=UPI003D0780BC